MMNKNMEEKKIEVRSERVRSIVGQMPPHLVSVALSVIAAVLLVSLGIAYFLPYKEVYSGTAVLYDVAGNGDPVAMKLRFGEKRPGVLEGGEALLLRTSEGSFEGKLTALEEKRDTLGRQSATATFEEKLPVELGNSETDFTLSTKPVPLLRRIITAKKVQRR